MFDRAEIFTMDRASKKTGPMFEEKLWFLIGPYLATVRPHQKLSDWAENFSAGTYDYISEVL